ncbi:hypothetical protein RND71_026245 [Anisodus tanguticus]|uniref:Uncharacterized protein n=1 Tax=Anisodus tanguticus TaxID=243964 RepID=A0AAE1RN74_9SOLA|nr:hypothetical protein RND71_026245 [Anisodus tanguticus]
MKNFRLGTASLIAFLILSTLSSSSDARFPTCKPNGKIKAKNPPTGHCNIEDDDICCIKDKIYTTYKCSPPVSNKTEALLTLNSFKNGEMDMDHQNVTTSIILMIHVLALSTGWYNGGARCISNITIKANTGRSVKAMVVDECDSTMGCDEKHDYQPPYQNNLVIASQTVWRALHVPMNGLWDSSPP